MLTPGTAFPRRSLFSLSSLTAFILVAANGYMQEDNRFNLYVGNFMMDNALFGTVWAVVRKLNDIKGKCRMHMTRALERPAATGIITTLIATSTVIYP